MKKLKIRNWEDIPPIFDIAYATELLRMSYSCVVRLAQNGQLPGATKIGKQWRINRDKFKKLWEDNKNETNT
jgi:excisionase family DNA binding protein